MPTDFLDPKCERLRAPGGIAITLCYLLKASPSTAGSLRYLSNRKLYKKAPLATQAENDLARYNRDAPAFASRLSELIPPGLDAIACVPSSVLTDIILPYREPIIKRFPNLTDLTCFLEQQQGNSSDGDRTETERLKAMRFTPPVGWPGSVNKILLVDDVWQSGTSLPSAAVAINEKTPYPLEFIAACPLWVVADAKQGPSMADLLAKMDNDKPPAL